LATFFAVSLSAFSATTSSWDIEKDGDVDKNDIAMIDKNPKDGKVSAAEAKAAGVSDADFKKADKNGDGYVDVYEMNPLYRGD
jgi:hypothetical protein